MEPQPTSPTRRLPRRPASAGPLLAPAAHTPWLLGGRYRVGEVIGRGGMSTVYRATDTVLDRPVAVKVLLSTLAESDPSHIERFRREARAVAALDNPGVVKIYDTGVDGDRHFLVMEYVEGRSLDEVLRGGQALEPSEAVGIAAGVADALAAAHTARILHRDIKPANVMLGSGGGVRVLDFGIARPLREATLTQPSAAMGTAAYMAPERVRGEPGDERSDIYALGCLLYAMLTGGPPFPAGEPVAVLHQQLHADPPPLRALGAGVSPGLETLTLSMLAKVPSARPQTAAAVAARLRGGGASVPPPVYSRFGGPTVARRFLPLALLAAVLLMVVALIALASSGGPGRSAGARAAAKKSHRHSYHRAATAVTPANTTAAPSTTAATVPATTPAVAQGPKGKGPDGTGPPGHDHGGQGGGPPGHGGGDGGD